MRFEVGVGRARVGAADVGRWGQERSRVERRGWERYTDERREKEEKKTLGGELGG